MCAHEAVAAAHTHRKACVSRPFCRLNFPYAYRRLETERVSAASKVGTEATLNAQRAVFKVVRGECAFVLLVLFMCSHAASRCRPHAALLILRPPLCSRAQ